jgi:hypothetical protein
MNAALVGRANKTTSSAFRTAFNSNAAASDHFRTAVMRPREIPTLTEAMYQFSIPFLSQRLTPARRANRDA